MPARPLDELIAADLLERQRPEPRRARSLLGAARHDLEFAQEVARKHPERALAALYEAGLRVCISLLLHAGYRLRSGPGHHRAAVEGTEALLGDAHAPLLRRLDGARRFRNEFIYGVVAAPDPDEIAQVSSDVGTLLDLAEARFRP